jgi:hypothetical protein
MQIFSPVQHIAMTVLCLEIAIAGNPSINELDGFTIIACIACTLTVISHNTIQYLLAIIITIIYYFMRTYNWIPDKVRYYRFNSYTAVSFVFIYIMSRCYVKLSRSRFTDMIRQ